MHYKPLEWVLKTAAPECYTGLELPYAHFKNFKHLGLIIYNSVNVFFKLKLGK